MGPVKVSPEQKQKKKEERIRLVELEILFARGWNSMTSCSLPHWRFWKNKLRPDMTDFEAFELGVNEYHVWATSDLRNI